MGSARLLTLVFVVVLPLLALAVGVALGILWQRRRRRKALGGQTVTISHSLEGALMILDAKGRVVDANPAAAGAYGFEREELLLFQFRDLLADEERVRGDAEWRRAWEHPGGCEFQTVQKRKDGSTFSVCIVACRIELGIRRYCQIFARSAPAEGAAIENKTLEARILDATPAAIWTIDRHGVSTYANGRGRELFESGMPGAREEWAGFVDAGDLDRFWLAWKEGISGNRQFQVGCLLRRADGEYRHFTIASTPQLSENNEVEGFQVAALEFPPEPVWRPQPVWRPEALFEPQEPSEPVTQTAETPVSPPAEMASLSRLSSSIQPDAQFTPYMDDALQRALEVSAGSVSSIAFVRDTFPDSHPDALDFPAYARKLAGHILRAAGVGSRRIRLDLNVENTPLHQHLTLRCAFIISELVTNAIRHAFPDHGSGSIVISLRRVLPGRLQLKVSDDGAQALSAGDSPAKSCSGLALVRLLVEQIGGELEIKRDRGFHVIASFPANAVPPARRFEFAHQDVPDAMLSSVTDSVGSSPNRSSTTPPGRGAQEL